MEQVAELTGISSCGHALESSLETLGFLRETSATVTDPGKSRARMDDDGYLLMRGLLDKKEVLAAREHIMNILASQHQLDPAYPIMEGAPVKGSKLFFQPELAQKNNPALQHLLYAPEGRLMQFFSAFLSGDVRHFDFTWLRCIAPGLGTPSHCDIVYMGRGTRRVYTAWVPLGDIDLTMGGLMVLEGSHKDTRLRSTYGQRDVDSYCENRPDDPARTANGLNGWLSENPNQIRRSLGGRWLVAEYEAGDAVIFCMDLVHGGLDNRSERLRLSSDSRYQRASEPIDERWVGENPPGHSAAGKRGRIC
jgi:Phytanoyl-CoA dioxygenase (PhyH)